MVWGPGRTPAWWGVTSNLPLIQTGGLSARDRKRWRARRQELQSTLKLLRRTAGLLQTARHLWRATSGVLLVAQQALKSAERSALAHFKLGIGLYAPTSMWNAQQQVTQVQRDLAQARVTTPCSNDLRLKAATGVLGENDLRATNAH